MYITFSKEIEDIPFINSFLGDEVKFYSGSIPLAKVKGVVGWGLKKTARKARRFAKRHRLPFISLEDGFICSYGLRKRGYPPLSVIVDPIGIYYDATRPSYIEHILNEKDFTNEELKIAEKALTCVIQNNISKFNYQPEVDASIIKGNKTKRVLVIDQTLNDLSVVYGMADRNTFLKMLEAAVEENPDADVYVKVHPDVINGKARGYLTEIAKQKGIPLITEDVNPLSLLRFFDRIYTVSSQMGFEALLLNKSVICFGVPFYAGWGLTDDRIESTRRRRKRSLIELFCAAYIKYPNYINPTTGEKGDIFDVINFIVRQREIVKKLGVLNYYCVDFHFARRKFIEPYIKSANNVFFIKSKSLNDISLSENSVILVWGNKCRKKIENKVNKKAQIITVEDGFIRSCGLGAEFVPPMSLVFDKKGIYYDPSQESDLEYILNTYQFSEEELDKAAKIRNLIVKNNITKYNMESYASIYKIPYSKKIILVPGQVEDDESVLWGGGEIKSNLQLLEAVRDRNPDSFIIYKPHPDVLSNNRRMEANLIEITKLADHIEKKADIITCINISDEIHTLTSLSGFDALLRDKKVYTYGAPFYAGWGLTEDALNFPRRKRKLTLLELIAGALLIYPVYYDWKLKAFADCETIIYRIIHQKKKRKRDMIKGYPKFAKKLLNYINFLRWWLFETK